ncbi:MAG TPA: PEGA domain-containing protein [Fibrobacteraceae bacterium]|nr:PEGA domain-containing protein [Fibrobacteraceae bacterium]
MNLGRTGIVILGLWFSIFAQEVAPLPSTVEPSKAASFSRLNIAVGNFEANGLPESDVNILTDRLRSELTNSGVFRVMERSQMDAILQEQSFQQSGACNSSECQVRIGQLLSVDRMVVGSVGLLGGSIYTISARLLDVSTGEVVLTANADYQGTIAGLLSKTIPELAQKLSGKTVEETEQPPVDPYAGKTGDLFLSTQQPGAQVLLDGNPVEGATPLMLNKIPAGKHRIRVILGNMVGQLDTIVPPNGLLKLKVTLSAMTGTLKVITNPPGFKASIEGTKLGSTPTLTEGVVAGPHELVLLSKEYLPVRMQVDVKPDSITTVDTSLGNLPKLSLDITPKNALVVLGSDSFPEWSGFKYVPQGSLQISVSSSGYHSHEELLKISQDLSKSIALEEIRMSTKRKIALAFLGAGALCGGGGWFLDQKVSGYLDDYNAATDRATGEAAYDDMKDAETYRNITYGAAIGSVLVAAILWFWPE